jgi:outer membrane receptor protein involved in Fe transport
VNLPENIVSSEIGYNGSISISKGHLINLSTNGIITYGTFANNIQVDKILQISKDSFIRKVNNQLSFSLNYSVPMKRSTTMNNLVGLIYADSWIRMNGGVSKVKNTFIISKITLTHNWRKNYYLKILASSTANFATVPVVNSKKIKSDVINYQLGSENKWLLNKHHQFLLYASWFTTNKTSFFYTDASWQFNISRIPFDFRLSVQNVTNEKKWVHGYDFGLVRSVQTMPLIPLNFMMQVRYTF